MKLTFSIKCLLKPFVMVSLYLVLQEYSLFALMCRPAVLRVFIQGCSNNNSFHHMTMCLKFGSCIIQDDCNNTKALF